MYRESRRRPGVDRCRIIRAACSCNAISAGHIRATITPWQALQTEAEALAERIFSNSHPIYAMLFDLQALDVVRTIEARD